jgi:hypothetical protein
MTAHPDHAGTDERLGQLPDRFHRTRLSMHRVAAYVVSPARRRVTGRIGLIATPGGFGTPPFADSSDETAQSQVRIVGCDLVHQQGSDERSEPLSTLAQAAAFLGHEPDVVWASQFDIPEPGDPTQSLDVDPASAALLARWYHLAFSVLSELTAEEASVESSPPQLWPEHFDAAIEIGADDTHQRASYGCSPGDATPGGQSEPYLYVSAWYPDRLDADPFWNSATFPGAFLSYRQLLAAPDQRQAALDFFRRGRAKLVGQIGP